MCVKFSMHRSVVHLDNVDGFFEKFECESYIFIRLKCNYRYSGRNWTCGHTNRSCLSPMVTVCYREFKLRVSENGKRQIRTFFAKFPLNVFISYFLACVERIVMHRSFKTVSSFTLYCLIPLNFSLPGVCRLPYNAKLKLSTIGTNTADMFWMFCGIAVTWSHEISGKSYLSFPLSSLKNYEIYCNDVNINSL
jgi:hypothetical protein